MKLAYPIATPEVRAAILGVKGPPGEMLPALRDAGYDAIEPFVADPGKFDGEAWARVVERSGLAVVAVGTGPLVFDDQLSFTAEDSARRQAAVERAKSVVRFAARLGAQVNIGKLRGEISASAPAFSRAWMRAAITEVCAEAARLGVDVTMEPQGRPTINNLNGTAEALKFITELGLPNFKIMLDTYHMDVEREDISAGVRLAAGQGTLWHVHFADTGRRAPGDGHIDFRSTFNALRSVGYDRAVTVEIKQEPDALSAARRAATYLRPLLSTS
jgi:sugar phosphate isomerase/epimerase